MALGKKLGAYALTEPTAGTDAVAQRTIVVLDDDSYILKGNKIFTINGGDAEVNIVFAVTDKEKKVRGISAFIVEKGTPGFTFGKKNLKWACVPLRPRSSFLIIAEFQKRTCSALKGEGFKIAMGTLDGGRNGIAAQAVGIAQDAMEEAANYAQNLS
jgi:butyryl-CoA dehydrogenase